MNSEKLRLQQDQERVAYWKRWSPYLVAAILLQNAEHRAQDASHGNPKKTSP